MDFVESKRMYTLPLVIIYANILYTGTYTVNAEN
jgi:hypothetical protein